MLKDLRVLLYMFELAIELFASCLCKLAAFI